MHTDSGRASPAALLRAPSGGASGGAWLLLCCACLSCVSQEAAAHGSVTAGEDLCIIQIGFYQAHFTIYQPRTRGHTEFCEDLPDPGETVFVMEYLHDSMREVPVDFRIVHDRENLGPFARTEDVDRLDLATDTYYYQPPDTNPDGVFTTLVTFAGRGDYIGIVTAAHPTNDKLYRAVFPFRVGGARWPYAVLPGGAAIVLAAVVLLRRRRATG